MHNRMYAVRSMYIVYMLEMQQKLNTKSFSAHQVYDG